MGIRLPPKRVRADCPITQRKNEAYGSMGPIETALRAEVATADQRGGLDNTRTALVARVATADQQGGRALIDGLALGDWFIDQRGELRARKPADPKASGRSGDLLPWASATTIKDHRASGQADLLPWASLIYGAKRAINTSRAWLN